MSHAKKIVVSTGGYSNLIRLMVEKRGGELVGRKFQWQFLALDYFQEAAASNNDTGARNAKPAETRNNGSTLTISSNGFSLTPTKKSTLNGNINLTTTTPKDVTTKRSSHPSDKWLTNCSAELSAVESGPFDVVANNAIGDCIKICQCYIKPKCTMNFKYKDLACKTKATRQLANLTIVDEIHRIQESTWPQQFVKPDNDTLVIHLRLKDHQGGSKPPHKRRRSRS
jgi:hypothetical protein